MLKGKIENYSKAADLLSRSLVSPVVDERDLAGIVKCFEMTYELAWTTLKTQLKEQGIESQGPRDVFKAAWRIGILSVGEESAWVKMIEDRNLTIHTYDEAFARAMVERIRKTQEPALQALRMLWSVV
jgi:nucleotidyltransferase substrate binding protein (TIGR01987 family)